jgi:membrane protein DedA with SNARE-associated domain
MSHVLSQFGAILLGTFASEDLTCISVGLLVREAKVQPLVGLMGCLVGIVVGDFGLWLVGRLVGRRVLKWNWIARRLPAQQVTSMQTWLNDHCGTAVLAARFLPGTRAVLFVAMGALGNRPGSFLWWSLVAACLWTPLLVLGTAALGGVVAAPLASLLGSKVWGLIITGGCVLTTLHFLPAFAERNARNRLLAKLSRIWRWEFWPSWLFYLPLMPWIAVLALRYRSWTVWTAANPGIPQGGVVGESKFAILSKLPARWTVASILIDATDANQRVEQLRAAIEQFGWGFPLILKPDAAQRGASVRRVRSLEEAAAYLAATPGSVIAQPYHAGPFEAGIFYYRHPQEAKGHIFSITDKRFPTATGDGHRTLEQLIWAHPRLRMQAATFLRRHADQRQRMLGKGEVLTLAIAGNHCQGTMFCDGSHLITPALVKRIDSIAKHFPGFYFGRFDVRYSDLEAFLAGDDLAIVELNGVTSESTNLYDPSFSLLQAYSILFRQWAILFAIGNANRRRGIQPTTARELLGLVRGYYGRQQLDPLAD